MFKRTVKIRNNFYTSGDGWKEYKIDNFTMGTSGEALASSATFDVYFDVNRLDETSATNEIRMFSEILVVDEQNGVSVNRFHGFINQIAPSKNVINVRVTDPIGFFGKKYFDFGSYQADIIKLGSSSTPVTMKLLVEDSEDRYVPDWTIAANYDAYIPPHPPPNPPTNYTRRTYQSIGRLRDLNADPNDYPDYIIPLGYYSIGSDLLNYIQFNGYDPTHGGTVTPNITLDFISVYEENTNQIEDIILDALTTYLNWTNTNQFNNTSSNYYVKTIWPSLITVNSFTWNTEDGSLAQMITKLLESFAPPNYKIFWRHDLMQLGLQYVEETPHNTTTAYYTEGSYAYGGISPDTPPFNNSYVDHGEIYTKNYPRDEQTFASEIVVEGTNKWPKNAIKYDSLTDLGVTTNQATFEANNKGVLLLNQTNSTFYGIPSGTAIPANWSQYGEPQHLLDFDFGTFFGMWWDYSNQPPSGSNWNYHPIFICAFDAIKKIEQIRFWGIDSKRAFQFGIRFEVCNDFDITGTTPLLDASWTALNSQLYDREFGPYEEVDVKSGFLVPEWKYCLIWIKPAKIAIRGRTAHALSDLEFIESKTITGRAKIIKSGDPVGTWTQTVGTGTDDGEYQVNLPDLYDQLNTAPTHDSNKIVVGQRIKSHKNLSLINTNMCALEAARILLETVRDKQQFGISARLHNNFDLYKTVRITDPQFGTVTNALADNINVTDWEVEVDCTTYKNSAWTNETPGAL